MDPFAPPIQKLADFLLYLFEEKNLATATIQGYRSAIGTTIRQATGNDLPQGPVITDLLASFFLSRPKARNPLPQWNLALVLGSLLKAPYEPLGAASLKHLTWKTVFLLTLAAGKRRGEIHALIDMVQHSHEWRSITLRPSPGFLAKTHVAARPEAAFTEVEIPALTQIVGQDDQDRLLCPVRAIKFYLDRTKPLRANRQKPCKLFLPYKVGHSGDVKPPTVSGWIRKTIAAAYENATEEEAKLVSARPHELRALSASWTAFQTVSLDKVLRAAAWRSHTTFTSFYLRDRSLEVDSLLSLGPIVTYKTIVGGNP